MKQQQICYQTSTVKEQNIPTIFLAGRIDQSDLRFGLVQYNMSFDKGDFVNPCKANLRKIQINQKEYLYSGSFKIGYDIPEDSEIYQNLKQLTEYKQFIMEQKNKGISVQQFLNKKTTYLRSMDGIQKATHIFVWIQDQECYGTLIQLGYVQSLNKNSAANKKIYIAYADSLNAKSHLWFAFQDCTKHQQFSSWNEGIKWFIDQI